MSESKRYSAVCLDPVHIGTGGYMLGRVDMTIVREPATGIPKIPGTSLAGAIRSYAEMNGSDAKKIKSFFGYTTEKDSRQGMLRFYDAQISLFPVSSHSGTVWVSTADRLKNLCGSLSGKDDGKIEFCEPSADKVLAVKGFSNGSAINLGWLLLEVDTDSSKTKSVTLPSHLSFVKRIVLVSDKLFNHIVNDNLEVRTSVCIDDKTGAAEEGALFTYEAIPSGTVLSFEIFIDDRRNATSLKDDAISLLESSIKQMKLLGIGGMTTRGFGRMDVSELGGNNNG